MAFLRCGDHRLTLAAPQHVNLKRCNISFEHVRVRLSLAPCMHGLTIQTGRQARICVSEAELTLEHNSSACSCSIAAACGVVVPELSRQPRD